MAMIKEPGKNSEETAKRTEPERVNLTASWNDGEDMKRMSTVPVLFTCPATSGRLTGNLHKQVNWVVIHGGRRTFHMYRSRWMKPVSGNVSRYGTENWIRSCHETLIGEHMNIVMLFVLFVSLTNECLFAGSGIICFITFTSWFIYLFCFFFRRRVHLFKFVGS